jgi:hypothetical protein
MTLLTEIKNKVVFWADLISAKRTAAEQVVHAEFQQIYKVLEALEGKIVVLSEETATKVKATLDNIGRDLTADEAKAKTELEGALGLTAQAAAANAAKQPGGAPQPAAPAPTPAPEASVPAPAAVAAAVEGAKPAEASPAPAPVVDVSGTVQPPAAS